MVVSSRRECIRWPVLIVHVFGWCGLPYMRMLLILYPIKQIMSSTLHAGMFFVCISSDALFCISTYASASYRIANRESSRRTRGARGVARGAASGGARGRRGGRWGAFGVPRSPPEFLWERQALEHFSLSLQLFNQCFTLIDALRSGVVCNRCCIIPCLPLYTISLLPWYPQSSQCLAGLDW
jgi:hypothetical protein